MSGIFDLPAGVGLAPHCAAGVGLHNCHALYFEYRYEDGSQAGIIAWRDFRKNIKPLGKKALRDLRPGDAVEVFGSRAELLTVQVYR